MSPAGAANPPYPPYPLYVAEPSFVVTPAPAVVVDSSVMCAFLFDEPERVDAMAQMSGKSLWAPRLLNYEVLSVAIKKLRKGAPRARLQVALSDFKRQAIDIADPLLEEQFALAQRYDLSAYDAAYLWLAAELHAPLLTFDKQLAQAARAHLSA